MKILNTLRFLTLTLGVTLGSALPLFAQSSQRLTKVVTVGEEAELQLPAYESIRPELVMELQDGLAKGDRFYLNLEGAIWKGESFEAAVSGVTEEAPIVLETKKLTDTQLELVVEEGEIPNGAKLKLPMNVQVKAPKAYVNIDSNNTNVTSEQLLFAYGSEEKGSVTAKEAPKRFKGGTIAPLNFEEAYSGQWRNVASKGENQEVLLTLQNSEVNWDLTKGVILKGNKGFETVTFTPEQIQRVDNQTLSLTLPEALKELPIEGKGGLSLEGLAVESSSTSLANQTVLVKVEADWLNTVTLPVIQLADYEVTAETKGIKEVLAGRQAKVEVTLKESLPESLVRNRSLSFELTDGVHLLVDEKEQVKVQINNKSYTFPAIQKDKKVVGFEIPSFEADGLKSQTQFDIAFDVEIPIAIEGQVNLKIEGRGLPKNLMLPTFSVKEPITSHISAFNVTHGVKGQKGGEVRLSENKAGALKANQSLMLYIPQENFELVGLPQVEVTKGDLKVGVPERVGNGVVIKILKASSVPSELKIAHFEMDINRLAADGYYPMSIGGTALSDYSEADLTKVTRSEEIDPAYESDFMLLNVKPKDLKVIKFRIGDESYSINGRYHHLDVPAYMEEGRMMVPVKYVAEALNISSDQVKWNPETEKITIYSHKIIELQIGSNSMKVDGQKVDMAAAAALVEGRTMVPIGEIARALDVQVKWSDKLQTAEFTSYQ